jgi:hypothetical protein
MASVTNNAVGKAGNGLGPRTQVIVTDAAVANDAALTAIINAAGHAGHSIAAVAGTANNAGVMHFALQGGGDATTPYGQAFTVVVDFDQNPV